MYLIYFTIFFILSFCIFVFLKKQVIIDSSNSYQNFILKKDNSFLSESKQYDVYFYIKQCLSLKNNIKNQKKFFENFYEKDDVLYKRLFHYYSMLNNFEESNYNYNLEGSEVWRDLFISARILNLKYTESDLENEKLPFFLRVYIGNGEDE